MKADRPLDIESITPVHFPSEEDIVQNLFLPLAENTSHFDCLSGYFSSSVLAELAEPLSLLFNKPNSKGRFLISPELNEIDKKAILEAYESQASIINYILPQNLTPSVIEIATIDVLKWLISSGKIDIRIIIKKEGMMHAKIWLFNYQKGDIAVHGSSNATKSGLLRNFEQLVVSKSWSSEESFAIVNAYKKRFDEFWCGRRDDSYTLKLNNKSHADLLSRTPEKPTPLSIERLTDALEKLMHKEQTSKLIIPDWLNYTEGDYAHQGMAVQSWLSNNKQGILNIATGGGKTLTSLVCASKAFSESQAALLLIAVPTKPLIKQWAEDVRNFSIEPIDSEGIGTKEIVRVIKNISRQHVVLPSHEVLIMTHDALKEDSVKDALKKYKFKIMLIGDEVHNLGVSKFLDNPLSFISYRLGLSATPERQYDEDGTKKLEDFFGGVVFTYGLDEAIGSCLVPFKYIAHKVYLTAEESDAWNEYTQKINNLMWRKDEDSIKLRNQLLIRRKAISEGAKEKAEAFKHVLDLNNKKYSLAFCTDKNPEQLINVNQILKETGYLFHQITGEESSNRALMRDVIESYKSGGIEILTSKRILDEGFNIPPIKTAYFLASSSTIRVWVQRLGRVLRKSDETGKEYAVVHDFIVLPVSGDKTYNSLIKGELNRMQWFMDLAIKDESLNSSIDISNELLMEMKKWQGDNDEFI